MSDEWPFTFPRTEFNAAENVGNQCGHVWDMNEVVSWSCDRAKGHDGLHGTDIWRGHPLRWTENGVPTPATADARSAPPPARSRADAEVTTEDVLLAHQLFYNDTDESNVCGCGERAPKEFIENYPHDWEAPNTPDAAWWAAHVADLLDTAALAERDSAMDQLGTIGHALGEARRRLATFEDEFPAVVRQRDALQAQLAELRAARQAGKDDENA